MCTQGVLVRGLSPLAAAASMLRRDDVILSVGDQAIANDGSFAVGAQARLVSPRSCPPPTPPDSSSLLTSIHLTLLGQERLSFQHLIHLRYPGELVPVQILRGGEILTLCVPVQPLQRLVPAVVYDESQPYFLYGGQDSVIPQNVLSFSLLDRSKLLSLGRGFPPGRGRFRFCGSH